MHPQEEASESTYNFGNYLVLSLKVKRTHFILILLLLYTLIACTKIEIPQPTQLKKYNVPHQVTSKNDPDILQSRKEETSRFNYIGLNLDQARATALLKNDRFRVVKTDGVELPVTLDFFYGRVSAEIVDGLVVHFSVEGVGQTDKPKLEGVITETCLIYFDGCNHCCRSSSGEASVCTEIACNLYKKPHCVKKNKCLIKPDHPSLSN